MADVEREAMLRREFHDQTARISWRDLEIHYARGSVVRVSPALDLVEVAVQLGLDNTARFEAWINGGQVGPVSADEARAWHAADCALWAVVAAPWVLVQEQT
jgi:hypothetical protein